jgi:hypothetical protein
MQYAFKAPGKKSLETDFVKLAAIPERSSRHPDLKFLAEALTNYLYKFRSYLVEEVCSAQNEYVQHMCWHILCSDILGLIQEPLGPHQSFTAVQQWNVLKALSYYHGSAAQIRVFHCLAMQHPECEGVQRVRCYPFPNHRFQGHNMKDSVFFKPVDNYKSDFCLPQDRELLEFGRVMLIFSILVPTRMGRQEEEDLVFIRYFKPYNIQGARQSAIDLFVVQNLHVSHMQIGIQHP